MVLPILKSITEYSSKVSWPVFVSICCFTIGAWLDINGLWCETVIMVHELPEKWRLSSILSASTQIAQIGPIFFLIGHHFLPSKFTYSRAIYFVLTIGATSCFLLAFFWNRTVFIGDKEYSLGLYILNFSLAILDGTSSVTFLPYIGGNFKKEYMIPNYIGESLAALVPSALALAQGLGKNPGCHNVTVKYNDTSNATYIELQPIKIIPNFSVQVYFLLMFVLLLISTCSFTFLNISMTAIRARKSDAISNRAPCRTRINPAFEESLVSSESVHKESICSENGTLVSNLSSEAAIECKNNNHNHNEDTLNVPERPLMQLEFKEKRELIILLSLIFMLSFICYGVLPGLQPYSTLPYGNDIYNYSVNLSFLLLPFAIFLSIWSYEVSVFRICLEFSIATAFSIYIAVLSAMSPCPPFMDSSLGPALTIISWILSQSMFMRIRCLIATRVERFGQTILLILGALTMFGQIFGGIIIFIMVNVYEVLEAKPECAVDFCPFKG